MPITETIGEQIVQAVATAFGTIQRQTYNVSVEVQRVAVAGNATVAGNKDALIQLVARAPVRDYAAGFVGRAFYKMLVGVFVNIRASDSDTVPPDAIQARVLADITKIVEANRQWGGLASDSIITSPKFGYDDAIPGADLILDVNFFTAQSNPYSLT